MRFFNKLALVCNICFLLCFVIVNIKGIDGKFTYIVSTVIVLGFIAIIVNILLLVASILAYIFKKKHTIPPYLFIINIVCFLIQIFYFIIEKSNGANQ